MFTKALGRETFEKFEIKIITIPIQNDKLPQTRLKNGFLMFAFRLKEVREGIHFSPRSLFLFRR